jgi:hypothetical protein
MLNDNRCFDPNNCVPEVGSLASQVQGNILPLAVILIVFFFVFRK